MTFAMNWRLAVGLALASALSVPSDLGAQDVEMRGWVNGVRPPPGYYEVLARDPTAYQFQKVWKEIAQQVRERRQALALAGDFASLNAHLRGGQPSRSAAQAAGTAIAGTFRFPVLVGYFSDSTHVFQPDTATLNSVLFSTAAAPPYSVSTYYDEMSNSLVTVIGDVIGWFKVDSASTWYEGTGKGLNPGTDHTGDFIAELLNAADPTIDFSVYDNDGDNAVDLVAVLHPLRGGECGSSHIWSHRWVLAGWGQSWSGDGVSASDYMIQPAVGGTSGCDSTQTMSIGTFSHELGHGMAGLPDLYDTGTGSPTFGIGVWGLMGSGNWNTQTSPAHLSAWSKDDVGWITVNSVNSASGGGSFTLNPIIGSDTALRIEIDGSSEYFLMENRHRLGSDVNAPGEGLLIWHVSPSLISARRPSNSVNTGTIHGLDLEQADGLDHLRNKTNVGDASDPYPGLTLNTAFGPTSTPNSEKNDNTGSGVQVDSITLNLDKSVGFRVSFNIVDEIITTSVGSGSAVVVDGIHQAAPFQVAWVYPSLHTIAVDSVQGDTLTRYTFQSWSDGGAREHSVAIDATPDTFTANLQTEFRLRANADLSGTLTSSVTLDVNGIAWLTPASAVQLVAIPNAGVLFARWSGDTTAITDTLRLTMDKPYMVQAEFGPPVAIGSTTLANGVMGAAYNDTLEASGGAGGYSWSHVGGDALPAGLTLEPSGALSGVPEESGSFSLMFLAESGAITDQSTVALTISRPNLLLDNVVNHLLSPVAVLSADELRFLDLIGNDNGSFDIGDFRAYLQDAGIVADVYTADLIEAQRERETSGGSARREDG